MGEFEPVLAQLGVEQRLGLRFGDRRREGTFSHFEI
jgi:hypothetical protein